MVVFRIDDFIPQSETLSFRISLWEIWPRFLGRRAIIRGGGNSNIYGIFTPNLGEDEPILTCAYFSKGLVQPPTSFPKSKEEIRGFHFLHPFFRWHTVLTHSGSLTASFLLKICKIPKTKGNSLQGRKCCLVVELSVWIWPKLLILGMVIPPFIGNPLFLGI